MDYEVILSPKAVKDFEAVVRYIALDSPEIASKFGYRLIEKIKPLGKYPGMGSPVPEFNDPKIRQLLLKPYRIIYKVDEENNRISIARFWHFSRDNLKI